MNHYDTTATSGLIPVNSAQIGGENINAVDARKLWHFLESRQEFSAWIKNRISQYGFEEGLDYTSFDNIIKRASGGGTTRIEYFISLSMAKELAMVEQTERGKQARRYFIECERQLKQVQAALPDLNNPVATAKALSEYALKYVEAVEREQLALAERDEAIRTKAQISRRREASALGKLSALSRKYQQLENQVGLSGDYLQVKGIRWLKDVFALNKVAYQQIGKQLNKLSGHMGYDVEELKDATWGKVKAYHREVIEAFRENLRDDSLYLTKYRKV